MTTPTSAEREAFEAWVRATAIGEPDFRSGAGVWAWASWQARAALTQPVPAAEPMIDGYPLWSGIPQPEQIAEPTGFVLVPVKPTVKMRKADGAWQGQAFWIRWEAILAACPRVAQPEQTAEPAQKRYVVECCNVDCAWCGPLSETCYCGQVGPLCPVCREVTEHTAFSNVAQQSNAPALSDKQIESIWYESGHESMIPVRAMYFARAILAAQGGKP